VLLKNVERIQHVVEVPPDEVRMPERIEDHVEESTSESESDSALDHEAGINVGPIRGERGARKLI
jgi:hypothetical protein